jgi:hypothetical protein
MMMKEKTKRILLWVLGLSAVLLIGVTAVDWIVMDGVMPTDIRSWITFLTPYFTIVIAFVIVVNSKPKDN